MFENVIAKSVKSAIAKLCLKVYESMFANKVFIKCDCHCVIVKVSLKVLLRTCAWLGTMIESNMKICLKVR